MAIRIVADTLAEIPSELQDSATEADGSFAVNLGDHQGWSVEDVRSLKSALSTQKETRRAATSTLERFKRDGTLLDPDDVFAAFDEVARLKEKLEAGETGDAATIRAELQAQHEARVEQLEKRHKTELQAETDGRVAAETEHEDTLKRSAALEAIGAHKANASLLLPHVLSRLAVRADELTKRKGVKVLNEAGEPMLSMKQGSQADMDAKEFVGTLSDVPEYMPCFPGSGATGTGLQVGNGKSGGATRESELSKITNPMERMRRFHEQKADA